MGLIVAFNGMYLTKASEEDEYIDADQSIASLNSSQVDQREKGFIYKLTKNMKQIGNAMTMPEIYMVISYFVINGIFFPDFGDFGYYFMMNTCKISKF
jgi:hypothetical protein